MMAGDPYASALVRLEDDVQSAIAKAERSMTKREIADELRRLADELEDEGDG
jgi:hypothetical protein